MVYKNMDELNDCYAIPREEMSFVKELLYVEDCFDTYESLGFCETYKNCYNGNDERNGMSFKVNRRVTTDEVDIEVLPMWEVTFENGDVDFAYPEEICKAERKEN